MVKKGHELGYAQGEVIRTDSLSLFFKGGS